MEPEQTPDGTPAPTTGAVPDPGGRTPPPRRRRLRKILRIFLWAGLPCFLVLAGLILALPTLVSTQRAREMVEGIAQEAVGRSVSLRDLRWTWSEGIRAAGLAVADDPAFSEIPFFVLEDLHADLAYADLFRGKATVALSVSGADLRVIRRADGTTNVEAFLADLAGPRGAEEPPAGTRGGPTALPLDVGVRIRLSDLRLAVIDRAGGHAMTVEDARFLLQAPSLRSDPIRTEGSARIILDGETLPPVRFEGRLADLFTSSGTLDLAHATVSAEGELPGIRFRLAAGLGETGIDGEASVDLPGLVDGVRPFLPPDLADAAVGGRLVFSAEGTAAPAGPVPFRIAVTGRGLSISAAAFGGATAGPVDFDVANQGEIDPGAGTLRLGTGELRIMSGTAVEWTGRAEGLTGGVPSGALTLGPGTVDLPEMAALAAPFLPDGIRISLPGDDPPARVEIPGIRLKGDGAKMSGSIDLQGLSVHLPVLEAEADGISLEGRGLRLDLTEFNGALRGFGDFSAAMAAGADLGEISVRAGSGAEPIRLSGRFGLDAATAGAPSTDIGFETRITGRDVAVRGPFSSGRTLGPAAFDVVTNGAVDPGPGHLEISEGSFRLREGTRAAWEGSLKGLSGGTPTVDLRMGDVRVDLAEILRLAGPLIPEGLGITLRSGAEGDPPAMKVEALRVQGALPGGPNPVRLEGLELRLPGADLDLSGIEGSLTGVTATVRRMEATLRDLFPASFSLAAGAAVEAADLAGATPLKLRGVSASAEVAGQGIRSEKTALVGISGDLTLKESFDLREAVLPGATLGNLTQEMDLRAALGLDTGAEVVLEALKVTVPEILVDAKPLKSFRTKASLSAEIPGVTLAGFTPAGIDLAGLSARLRLGEILRADVSADAAGGGGGGISGRGSVAVDLDAIPQGLLIGLGYGGTKVGGRMEARFQGAGRTPSEIELAALAGGSIPDPGKDLPFLEGLTLSGELSQVSVDVDLGGGSRLTVGDLSTPTPFQYRFGGGTGTFSGVLAVSGLSHAPGLGGLNTPLSLRADISGEHQGLASVRVAEVLAVPPLNLNQSLDLRFSGIDRALAASMDRWPKLLGVTVDAEVSLAGRPDLSVLGLAGISLAGEVDGGLRLTLDPASALKVAVRAGSPGLDAAVNETLDLRGLQIDLDLEKRYRLDGVPAGRDSRVGPETPLSTEVMRPEALSDLLGAGPATASGPASGQGAGGVLHGLRGRYGGRHTFSLDSARVAAGPIPLRIGPSLFDLRLENGLPRSDFFQLDLLGGTVMGAFAVTGSNEGHRAEARIAFSGIDTALLAAGGETGAAGETDITGDASIAFPLTDRIRPLLSGLDMTLNLSHVGSRSLERALFALDPHESDESIVSLRRLLRTGTPRWVRITIRRGNLSLTGEVSVKGAEIAMPRVDRLNLARLAGLETYEAYLETVPMVLAGLEILSARSLSVTGEGGVRFGE